MDPYRQARLHYAWVILAVTCLTVVLTAGVTAVPAVLIHPLEVAFGWNRAAIALAISINVFLYGLAGPFAGRLMRAGDAAASAAETHAPGGRHPGIRQRRQGMR
jgi:hypothetical protein